MVGVVRGREERKSRAIVAIGEGREGDDFILVYWDGDRCCPGGQMILCGGRTEDNGWGYGKSDGRRGGWGGFNKCT